MKKLLIIGLALAASACGIQESALRPTAAQAPQAAAVAAEDRAAERREKRRQKNQGYSSTLERKDMTGSRINRVRRQGEPDEDSTAGQRIETISREQIEEAEVRGYDSLSKVLPPGG